MNYEEKLEGIDIPDVDVTILNGIGQYPTHKKGIENYTRNLIKRHPTHVITGGYSIGNLEHRPENIFSLVKYKKNIELILNHNLERKQLIIYGDPSGSTIRWLEEFSAKLSNLFFFCSGDKIAQIIDNSFIKTDSCKNIVFILNKDKLPDLEIPDNIKLFHQTSTAELKDVGRFYRYTDLTTKFVKNPHCLLYDAGKPVAGARTNEFSKEISIIGGVSTKQKFRQRGYGFLVSYFMTRYLSEQSEIVALETDTENFPAIKIYEKIGFERIGSSMFIENNIGLVKAITKDVRDY